MRIAEKNKNKIYIYQDNQLNFEDTYNIVHISEARMKAWSLKDGEYKKDSIEYKRLSNYFDLVNLFAEKIEVPNKEVVSDRNGTSKLIRKGSTIEIARRYRRTDGTYTCTTKTPNCCYIDNATREKFFRAVKEHGRVQHTPHGDKYLLTAQSGGVFDAWSRSMDREYTRLSGIDFARKRKQTRIDVPREFEQEIRDLRFSLAYNLNYNVDAVLEPYIKRNRTGECVYDIDGFFLQYAEDPVEINKMLQVIEKIPLNELTYLAGKVNPIKQI